MKGIFRAFVQLLRVIWQDRMLVACLFAPVLIGAFFRFGIPAVEQLLREYLKMPQVLSPYYLLFDLMLLVMTPLMLSFAGVMVMLEELDNGTAKYLMVTPLAKGGYLASRIALPTAVSVPYGFAALTIFGLSKMDVALSLGCAVFAAVVSVIVSMFVVAFAKNKVEGMALIKLSGFLIMGFIVPFFISSPMGYLAGVLPSFWLGRLAIDGNWLFALPTLAVSALWMAALYRKFSRKLL